MRGHPGIQHLFRPLVVGAMVSCLPLSLVEFLQPLLPTWDAAHVIVISVLAALAANYSFRLIQARSLHGIALLRFRAVELVMFFLVLKVASYAGDSWADVLADIRTWPRHPASIFEAEVTVAFGLALLSWLVSSRTFYDLERLDKPSERDAFDVPPMESLARRFFWGGVVLLMMAGLPHTGITQLLNLHRPSVPGLMFNVLAYFVLGLTMLGQVHYVTLRRGWQLRDIKVIGGLADRWVRYSLAFIGLAALVALMLPAGNTGRVLEMVRAAPALFVALLVFLVAPPLAWLLLQLWGLAGLVFLLIMPLVLWLLSKVEALRGVSEIPSTLVPTPAPTAPSPPGQPGTATGWYEMVRLFLFWLAMLGMILYVVRSYLHDRPELWEALTTLGPIRALRRWWAVLWRWLGRWAEAVGEHLPRRLAWGVEEGTSLNTPFRFFRLGALPPRERVLYYYLSIVRRVGQRGYSRQRAQTPYEFSAALKPRLPQVQPEMALLTQAFVEARYSRHVVGQDQARQVRANWQRVKAALRGLRRKPEVGEPSGASERELTALA